MSAVVVGRGNGQSWGRDRLRGFFGSRTPLQTQQLEITIEGAPRVARPTF